MENLNFRIEVLMYLLCMKGSWLWTILGLKIQTRRGLKKGLRRCRPVCPVWSAGGSKWEKKYFFSNSIHIHMLSLTADQISNIVYHNLNYYHITTGSVIVESVLIWYGLASLYFVLFVSLCAWNKCFVTLIILFGEGQ